MAFPVLAGQKFEVRVLGQADSQAIVNIHKVVLLTVAGGEDSQTFLQSVTQALFPLATRTVQTASNYGAQRTELARILGTELIPGSIPPRFRWTYGLTETHLPVPPTGVGSAPTPYLPTYAAVAIGFRAEIPLAVGNPWKVRGGNRFGSLPEIATDNAQGGNVLTAAALADWSTFATDIFTQLLTTAAGSTFRFAIGSLSAGLVLPTELERITPIVSASVNPFVSSQVSRKRRPILG